MSAPAADQERLGGLGEQLGNAALVRMVETLGQAIVDMRGVDAADPRLVLEVALVRLSRRDAGPPLQTVIERIERLERAVAGGGPTPAPSPSARPPGRTIGSVRADAGPADEPEPAPEPPPEPVAAPPAAVDDGRPLDLDDVIVAWGQLLPGFSPATRAAVQSAQPVRVEGNVVTFGVAPALLEAARPRFKKEADTIRAALAERLGQSVKFTLVASEEFSAVGDAAHGRPAPPPTEPEPDPVDLEEVADATDAPPRAPEARLTEELGATVVEEVPRQ